MSYFTIRLPGFDLPNEVQGYSLLSRFWAGQGQCAELHKWRNCIMKCFCGQPQMIDHFVALHPLTRLLMTALTTTTFCWW